jgi:hypothetical protein
MDYKVEIKQLIIKNKLINLNFSYLFFYLNFILINQAFL